MNACSIAAVALLATTFVLGAPQASVALEAQRGQIAAVAGTNLIVRTHSSEFETFALLAGCRITRDGRPAVVTDLRTGDAVHMTAEQREGRWYASAVAAHTPY